MNSYSYTRYGYACVSSTGLEFNNVYTIPLKSSDSIFRLSSSTQRLSIQKMNISEWKTLRVEFSAYSVHTSHTTNIEHFQMICISHKYHWKHFKVQMCAVYSLPIHVHKDLCETSHFCCSPEWTCMSMSWLYSVVFYGLQISASFTSSSTSCCLQQYCLSSFPILYNM